MFEERTIPLVFFLFHIGWKRNQRGGLGHITHLMQVLQDLFSQKAGHRLEMEANLYF